MNQAGSRCARKPCRDAKFGIYTHWGLYWVPAKGPNRTWYPYNMYRPGKEQYDYHVETYGPPEKLGYKDFIPMFTAEHFDADEWAQLFHASGAQFAGMSGRSTGRYAGSLEIAAVSCR